MSSGGHIKEYIGDVYEFLRKRDITTLSELERKATQNKGDNKKPVSDYEEKKRREKELKQITNKVSKAEKNIADMETALVLLERRLADPQQITDYASLATQYEDLKKKLDIEMSNWTVLVEEKAKLS